MGQDMILFVQDKNIGNQVFSFPKPCVKNKAGEFRLVFGQNKSPAYVSDILGNSGSPQLEFTGEAGNKNPSCKKCDCYTY